MRKAKAKAKVKRHHRRKNVLFPGRPNYTGPISGLFGWVHHAGQEGCIVERSKDIQGRVDFIQLYKRKAENAIRLYSLVRIPEELIPERIRNALSKDHSLTLNLSDLSCQHKRVLDGIALSLVPTVPWDNFNRTLIFYNRNGKTAKGPWSRKWRTT